MADALQAHLLVQQLDAIPTPSSTALRMLELALDPETTAARYACVIATDPGLVLQVLRDSNTAERRALPDDLRGIVDGIGDEFLRHLAFTTCTTHGAEGGEAERASGMTALRRHCHAVAVAAAELARRSGEAVPEEAFTAGLIAGVGHLALAAVRPEQAARLCALARGADDEGLRRLENELFGCDHEQLALALAEGWDLAPVLREVLRYAERGTDELSRDCPHRDQQLVTCVRAARAIAERAGCPAFEGLTPVKLPADVEDLLRTVAVDEVVAHVEEACAQAAECARPRCEDPDQRLDMLRTANNELAHLLARSEQRRRSADSVTKVLRFGLHRLGEGDPLAGLMYLTMESMNFKRITFVRPEPEEGRLVVGLSSAMRGSQRVPEQSWVPFPARARALALPAIVTHEDAAPERQALLGLLGVRACAVAPLVDQEGHCHGYLAADKGKAGGPPAPGDDRCLGIIADQACLLLEYGRLTREMEQMATVDPLTGAATRHRLMDRLEHLLALTERTHQPLSLAIMDIDHFKRFNDALGHQAGDRLLVELVGVLNAATRKNDLLARYGGEEFVLVLPGAALAGAKMVAEELRAAVEEFGRERARDYGGIPVSISIGVAELRLEEDGALAENAMTLIGRADQALYRAKHKGRDRVEEAA